MSANNKSSFDTKIMEDDNGDSGIVSGPIDHLPGDEESESPEPTPLSASEDKKVLFDSEVQPSDNELDSGIVDLSECLSSVQLTETPKIAISPPEQKNIPPIVIFYQQDADGDTQLHIASVHGCEKSVGTLIRVCPNKALLDVANDDGHTPLHLAVMSGNAVVTRMLVRAGLSLEARDTLGETPLHKATIKGYVQCIQALVHENPPRKLSSVLNQKNYNGQACVHLAASTGQLEVLQTLVYYGADINSTESLSGSTALHIAARRDDVRLVQYLCERCPGVALQARDYANRTPRRLARRTAAARVFANLVADDSDSDSDSDDDMSDNESLYERLQREAMNANNLKGLSF